MLDMRVVAQYATSQPPELLSSLLNVLRLSLELSKILAENAASYPCDQSSLSLNTLSLKPSHYRITIVLVGQHAVSQAPSTRNRCTSNASNSQPANRIQIRKKKAHTFTLDGCNWSFLRQVQLEQKPKTIPGDTSRPSFGVKPECFFGCRRLERGRSQSRP